MRVIMTCLTIFNNGFSVLEKHFVYLTIDQYVN